MAHHLNWSPGKPGKGTVLTNGDIRTWPVDIVGEPGHPDQGEHFSIAPDGYLRSEGEASPQMWQRIMLADPRTHREGGDDDWAEFSMDNAPKPKQDHFGPDFNYIMSHVEPDEPQYALMLGDWLSDMRGGAPSPVAPSLHHNTPEDIVPKPPASSSPAPSYWPAGHVPDWADPMAEGRTASETLPDIETTEGDWFSTLSKRLIARDITPEQFDHAMRDVQHRLMPPQAPWLERLVD